MANLGNFGNLNNAKVQSGFELRAPGDYIVRVTDTDLYEKNGNQILKIEFEIEDDLPGSIFEYYSFAPTPTKNRRTVAEISQDKLKTIATYGGHRNPNYITDTEELHGLRLGAKIKVEKDESGQYEPKNRIAFFQELKQQPTATIKNEQQPTPQEQQANMPWEE